jgi:hypothetical protein
VTDRIRLDELNSDQYDALLDERDQLRAAVARGRAVAEELVATGPTWDGDEREAGRRVLAALNEAKES